MWYEPEKEGTELRDQLESDVRSALYDMNLEQLKLLKKVVDNLSGLQAIVNILNPEK